MIGTDLNLDLPTLSDTYSVALAKTTTALQEIEDSIADKATAAALNITTALSFNGNHLTDVGGVLLVAGNTPTSAGSLYYTDGKFYLRDATGIIQLTSAGAINVAGVGGIGGDYGGSNPASVVFDDASGEFRFTEEAGVYADVRVDDVILVGTSGTVRLGVDPVLSGNRTVLFEALPSSGVSMMVYDASDSSIKDGAITRCTGTQLFTGINASADLTVGGDFKHADRSRMLPLTGAEIKTSTGTGMNVTALQVSNVSAGPVGAWWQTLPLRMGDRIKSFVVLVNKPTTSSLSVKLHKTDGFTLTSDIATQATTASGNVAVILTLGTPQVIAVDEMWFIEVTLPTSGDTLKRCRVTWDRP
jgi:hypothetical protein